MGESAGIGGNAGALWYRVLVVNAGGTGGTAASDYASVLPAALHAARHRRPFIAGWLSRGGGAPLELITTAGPLPEPGRPARLVSQAGTDRGGGAPAREASAGEAPAGGGAAGTDRTGAAAAGVEPAGQASGGSGPRPPAPRPAPADRPVVELLFPWAARGVPIDSNMLADLDQLVWAPCPGRQVPLSDDAQWPRSGSQRAGLPRSAVPRFGGGPETAAPDGPTLFESALQTLMGRPFGWLIVADPTDLLDGEAAELRNQLTVLRRYDDENARFEASRAEGRLAELDAFREAGLWNVRVLAGAATEQDLRLIAPVLVGSADLSAHPYRLRCPDGAQEFADVLATKLADPADSSMVPFAATAGALAALTGLPRHEVPGVRVMRPGYFDVTSEVGGEQSIELGEPPLGPARLEPRVLVLVPPQHRQLVPQLGRLAIEKIGRVSDDQPAKRPAHQRLQRRLEQRRIQRCCRRLARVMPHRLLRRCTLPQRVVA